MKRRSRAGVTLIELMIAVSLLGLLSVGILFALRVGLLAMDRTDRKLMANRRVLSSQRVLEQQVAGLMPVFADCAGNPGAPPQRGRFFEGEPQEMRFVSSYSLGEGARGFPRILEYKVIPGEAGAVRLVVNEILYSGPESTGAACLGIAMDPELRMPVMQFRPVDVGPQSFVLADKLASCNFSYLEMTQPPEWQRWVTRFVAPLWPLAIRIEMKPAQPEPGKIAPVTFTAPVHVSPYPDAGIR